MHSSIFSEGSSQADLDPLEVRLFLAEPLHAQSQGIAQKYVADSDRGLRESCYGASAREV